MLRVGDIPPSATTRTARSAVRVDTSQPGGLRVAAGGFCAAATKRGACRRLRHSGRPATPGSQLLLGRTGKGATCSRRPLLHRRRTATARARRRCESTGSFDTPCGGLWWGRWLPGWMRYSGVLRPASGGVQAEQRRIATLAGTATSRHHRHPRLGTRIAGDSRGGCGPHTTRGNSRCGTGWRRASGRWVQSLTRRLPRWTPGAVVSREVDSAGGTAGQRGQGTARSTTLSECP